VAGEVADDAVDLQPGYSSVSVDPASRSTDGSTSKGTKRRSVPAARSAVSSWRVLSDVPLPSSTRTSAPAAAAISPARAARIARSARVG
jgi:hypothetical protein